MNIKKTVLKVITGALITAILLPTYAKQAIVKNNSGTTNLVQNAWKGSSLNAGGSLTTGNSSSTTFNLGGNLVYTPSDHWSYNGNLNYLYNRDRDNNKTSSNQLTATAGTRYFLTQGDGIYADVYYLKDMLGSYVYYVTESIGYSRRFVNNSVLQWDINIGPSFTQKKIRSSNKKFNDLGGLFATNLNWQISTSANLLENVRVNYTKNGTLFTNKTTLALKIYENLSVNISFEASYNSNVQGSKKKLDTITGFTLAYNF